MLLNDGVLPELCIEDMQGKDNSSPLSVDNQSQVGPAPEQIQGFLLMLRKASDSASNQKALVQQVQTAAYTMVGFGPMMSALKALS